MGFRRMELLITSHCSHNVDLVASLRLKSAIPRLYITRPQVSLDLTLDEIETRISGYAERVVSVGYAFFSALIRISIHSPIPENLKADVTDQNTGVYCCSLSSRWSQEELPNAVIGRQMKLTGPRRSVAYSINLASKSKKKLEPENLKTEKFGPDWLAPIARFSYFCK